MYLSYVDYTLRDKVGIYDTSYMFHFRNDVAYVWNIFRSIKLYRQVKASLHYYWL